MLQRRSTAHTSKTQSNTRFQVPQCVFALLVFFAAVPAWAVDYSLVYSETSNRAGSIALSGATVADDIFVRLTPEDGGIKQVRFYLDGSNRVYKKEGKVPYDLRGGPRSRANAFDTTDLADGTHSLRTEIDLGDGSLVNFNTVFYIANNGPLNSAPVLAAIANQNMQTLDTQIVNLSATDADGDALSFSASGLPSFAVLNDQGNGTATLALNPLSGDAGSYSITISASDGALNDSVTFGLNITAPVINEAPVLGAIAAQTVIAGESLVVALAATDANGDSLSFSATLPSFASLTDNGNGTARVALSPSAADVGLYSLSITVSDGELSDNVSFNVTVNEPPPNEAPILGAVAAQTLIAGDSLVVTLAATDVNGDFLSFSATLPSFASLTDNGNGTASVTLSPSVADAGLYSLSINVSDGELSDSVSFNVTVNEPPPNEAPILGAVAAQTLTAGDSLVVALAATDANGDSLSFTGTLPAFASLTDNGNGTASVTLSPSATDAGLYSLSINVSDGELGDSVSFNVTVNAPPPNTAPVLNAIGAQSMLAGENLVLAINASDAEADALSFSTSALPGFIRFSSNAASARLTLTPGAADVGTYTITVTVSDAALSDSETFTLSVGESPAGIYSLVYSETSNRAGSIALSGATMTGNMYVRLIPEEGGIKQVRFYLDGSNRVYKKEGKAPYDLRGGPRSRANAFDTTDLADGTHSLRTEIDLGDGSLVNFNTVFYIANNGPLNSAPVLAAIANQNMQTLDTQIVNLSATDADGDALSFSASGLPSFAVLNDQGNGTATLAFNPLSSDAGSYSMTISVGDGRVTVDQSFSLVVASMPIVNGFVEISEFMATNTSTLADADGSYEDWIELTNTDTAAVDLTGWCLTDDPLVWNSWCFPAVTLAAGESLVVFASNKVASVDPAELHTGFRLGNAGEYLGLYRADGLLVHEYAPAFPAQSADVSYGLNASGQVRYFTNATPGSANGDGVSDVLSFSDAVQNLSLMTGASSGFQLTLATLLDEVGASYTLSVNDGGLGWLSATASLGEDGLSPDLIDVSVNAAALAAGSYSGTVTASAAGYGSATLTVNLSVFDSNAVYGSVEISEIMAANTSTLFDADGSFEDWIELNNTGTTAVDLTGWCLTDDPLVWNSWCFPAVTLAAGEYLVVFASNKVASVDPTELHAGFRLGNAGEYLGLYHPNSTLAHDYSPGFPAQASDVSYGLDASGGLAYFPSPTPGAANGGGVGDVLSFGNAVLNVSTMAGTSNETQQMLATLLGNTSVSYTLSIDDGGLGWLSATIALTDDGLTPDLLDIGSNASALTAGSYSGTVTASAPGYGSAVLTVNLTVFDSSAVYGSVEISEIMAANASTLLDADGSYEDWIELNNTGTTAVDLTGWCLTDDPLVWNRWCFPAVTLAAGEYLVVFASNKVASVDPTELHAGFRLGNAGEYLGLYHPNSTLAHDYSPGFPAQTSDVSYGLDASGGLVYFPSPTPGAANGGGVNDVLSFSDSVLALSIPRDYSLGAQLTLATFLGSVNASYALSVDDAGLGWLSATTAASENGLTPDLIDLNADALGLVVGDYSATVTASAPGYIPAVATVNLTVLASNVGYEAVEISEFMASNDSILADADGSYEDWIELHNRNVNTVNLSGWCLTDDSANLSQWCFSGDVLLGAGERLLVFASNKVPAPAGEHHATFKLKAGGEYLALVRPDGSIAHEYAPLYPPQSLDVSYGIDGEGAEVFFLDPTPGASNGSTGSSSGELLTLSAQRGFYDAPFQVSVTADATVEQLRYTTDGSEPSLSNGDNYTGPVDISTTTVLRVAAFAGGSLLGRVESHSYIFLDDVIYQPAVISGYPNNTYSIGGAYSSVHDYEMDPDIVYDPAYSSSMIAAMRSVPTMSVSLPPEDIFGSAGFYETSGIEKAVSVEILYPDDAQANHQANAGVNGHSHNRMKRSMRLNFRAEYGDSKFETDLLDRAPLNGDTADGKYNKLVLRAGNNRCWCRRWNPDKTAYTVDQFARDTQIAVAGYGVRGTFVHLYINGLYWGLYNVVERPDSSFLSDYLGGTSEDWYSVNHGLFADGQSLSGDNTRYEYLTKTLIYRDMSDPANYAEFQQYLDVDAFINYMIANWWAATNDWPDNNWYAGNRNETAAEGTTGLMYIVWDAEATWDAPQDFGNSTGQAKIHPAFLSSESVGSVGRKFVVARIWHAARQNADFMARFATRVDELTGPGGALSDAVARERWTVLTDYVREAVIGESARWGDTVNSNNPRTRDDDWQREVDDIYDILGGNAAEFRRQLAEEGYIP